MISITESTITDVVRRADREIVAGFVEGFPEAAKRFDITTEARVEHFLAQCAHESSGFTRLTENLNYSAKRMTEVWPSRFPTIASAKPYAHNPKALAVKTYGGRMGNRPGTDDGWRYAGKGPMQATGLEMFEKIQELTGLPLVDHPEMAAFPRHGAMIAGAIWHIKGCNALADRDDIRAITKRINGGTHGLSDRIRYRKAFASAVTSGGVDRMWLRRGDHGARVEDLQRELVRLGYYAKVDGDFGEKTERAVVAFQRDHGLDDDGLVGTETLEAMESAVPPEKPSFVETLKKSTVAKVAATGTAIGSGKVVDEVVDTGPDVSGAIDKVADAGEKARQVTDAVDGFSALKDFALSNLPLVLGVVIVGLCAYILWRNHGDILSGKKKS